MSIKSQELTLPTAAQRIEARWFPDPGTEAKITDVRTASRIRLIQIVHAIQKNAQMTEVRDTLAYLAGASEGTGEIVDSVMSDIVCSPQLIEFILSAEKRIGEYCILPDYSDLHESASRYLAFRNSKNSDEELEKTLKNNLKFQIHRFLYYLRQQAQYCDVTIRQKLGKLLIQGVGSEDEFVDAILQDSLMFKGFAVVEQLLFNAIHKPEFAELPSLVELLENLEGDNPIAH